MLTHEDPNLADEEVMKGSTTTKTLEPSYNTYPTLGIHNECKSKGIFRRRKDRPLKIQERKVVRSNSEERIIKKNICNKSIRRVSSHEDFKRVPSHEDFKRVQITDATLKENEIPNTNIKSFDVIVKPFDVKSHKFDVKSQQFDVKSQKFEVKPQKFDAKSQKFDAKSQRFDVPRQNFDKLHIDATSQQCNFKHLNVSQYDVYQFDFNKYHMRHFAVVSQNLDSKIEEESNNMNVETNASELEASMDTVDIFQASEAPKNDTKNLDSIDQTELDKFDKLGQSKLDAAKSDYSKLNYSKFDHSKLDCSKFDSSMTDPVKFDPSFSTSTFDSIKFDPSKFDAAYFDSSKFDALSTGTKQNPFKYSHKLDSKFETMKYEAKSFELNKFDVQKHEVQFDLSTDPKKLDIKKTEKKIGDINPIKYDIKKLESKKSEAFNQDEYEWKRSGERLFRVPLHRRKYFYKRSPKVKHMSSQHDDKSNSEESYKSKDFYLSKDTLPLPENSFGKKESSSPYQSPSSSVLDLSALHKQIDCSEPIPSSTVRPVSEITEYSETMPGSAVAQNALLSSPRNSIIATERIYLNQYVAQNKNTSMKPLNPLEKRLNHLSKQMKKIKKNIRQFEYEFEQKRGYKPSEMDKMRDFNINSLLTDLQNLKKEYKQIKRYDRDVQVHPTAHEEYTGKMNVQQSLAETLSEIDQKLLSKRLLSERPSVIEEMTSAQLLEEKIDIQKGLLFLQTKHGRPSTKEDKDLVRPLYDRYRVVKRLISRTSLPNNSVIELATIHEHETLTFVTPEKQQPEIPTEQARDSSPNSDDGEVMIEKGLHALSLNELIEEKKNTEEEKKKLHKSLKEFENNFKVNVGRKMQKDDKEPIMHIYNSYKKTKSKLKLLDALLKKTSLS